MYTNLKKAGLGGFGSSRLWSSSQSSHDLYSGYGAWSQDFSDGGQNDYAGKGYDNSVRVCRAFTNLSNSLEFRGM
ncbi:MAG: hypothetical protein WCQ50_17650 [Spirochaetota bacterium]